MSNEERRCIVQDSLDQRRQDRFQREADLEEQARKLRQTINRNHTLRTMTEMQRRELRQEEDRKRRQARAEAKAAEAARVMAAENAVRYYGLSCLVILLLSICTKLPLWAGVTLALGLAVFPTVYVFRLYHPLSKEGI